MCGAQLDQGQNCNRVCKSVQQEIHCSRDQPSYSQEEYASECHIPGQKNSPLNSGNLEQHNKLLCWVCHSMHIPKITFE
jgi:hypothetical protein